MRLTGAYVFDSLNGFTRSDLCTDGAYISQYSNDNFVLDASRCFLIPGLTDLHFHGCNGADFSDSTRDSLSVIAEYELSRGITQICPASVTLSENRLSEICKNVAAYHKTAINGADLVGINLEGPFLSYEKMGAQNESDLRKPDLQLFRRLLADSDGLVKLISVAPELPGALEWIKSASKEVIVSIAHTAANYDTALAAFAVGARHVTHLYNAMPAFAHRAPGVIGAAADSDCFVELICDGVHIHPSVVRSTFKLFGKHRVVLVSDSMRATGLSDGEYTLGNQVVTVNGLHARLSDGTLAGSVTDLMNCLKVAVSFGIPLSEAVTAAALNPAKVLGIDNIYGTLEPNKVANIIVLESDLSIRHILFHGELIK